MTSRVVPIVEGHGEVKALPVLLRRLCSWLTPDSYTDVETPIRVRRDRFLNKDRIYRMFVFNIPSVCANLALGVTQHARLVLT